MKAYNRKGQPECDRLPFVIVLSSGRLMSQDACEQLGCIGEQWPEAMTSHSMNATRRPYRAKCSGRLVSRPYNNNNYNSTFMIDPVYCTATVFSAPPMRRINSGCVCFMPGKEPSRAPMVSVFFRSSHERLIQANLPCS